MKKDLLIALFLLIASFNCQAGEFIIENHLGINCLKHELTAGETFYKVAQKYFVRPSTLAIVNNIENAATVSSGSTLYIPLTETNFYTTKGLEGSKFSFEPALYQINEESKLSELADVFFVNIQNLKDWNADRLPLKRGDKVVVGWVKYEKEIEKIKTPLFVQKEKIIYGNLKEKAEAKAELKKLDAVASNKSFPDYSIPAEAVPAVVSNVKKKSDAETKKVKVPKRSNKLEIEEKKKVKRIVKQQEKKVVAKKKVVKKKTTTRKKTSVQKITKAEKKFLEKKIAKPKAKNKIGFLNKVRKLTKNSYSRDKKKNPESVVKVKKKKKVKKAVVKKIDTKIAEPKNEVKKVVRVKKKQQAVPVKKVVVDKTYNVNPVDTIAPEEPSDPLYVENKMQRLTLLKSTKGRASFFYSGTAGAKFYVFTNLAAKGGIIKLTNVNNNKYLLAQVIGPLPEADRKRGYIISLSDNSRRLLGVKAKSFTGKINY